MKTFTSNFPLLAAMLLSLAVIPQIPVVRAADIAVTVGGLNGLRYSPQIVNAKVGDTVVFTFMQKNHTATQSTFGSPCVRASGGFDTGFQPVADTNTQGPFPQARLNVSSTNPIWVYCRQANHCEQGMVFAVNPGDQFSAFQAAAMGNNGTSSSATAPSAASTTVAVTTTAPPATVSTVTATVTLNGATLTTTYGSYPGSAQPTSLSSTDHQITVGGSAGLVYTPSNITAQVGDTITFTFMQKNHTVTQSSFANPCRSLTLTSTSGQVGFDSGFNPVAEGATTFPKFTIRVNDTSPIWVYCRQTGHCGMGMVFSANAIESGPNNFGAFKALAMQLNGTQTASGPQSTGKSSAMSLKDSRVPTTGAGVVLGMVGLVGAMWL